MAQLNRFLTFALLAALSFQLVIASPNVKSGVYKIKSLLNDAPIGVGLILPGFQHVYLNAPVKTWVVRKEGNNEFRLSVGGYPFTGNIDDGVAATIHEGQGVTWIVKYAELQDAYTIELPDTRQVWTVSPDSERAKVEIAPIIIQPTEPPRFITNQLWRFVAVEE